MKKILLILLLTLCTYANAWYEDWNSYDSSNRLDEKVYLYWQEVSFTFSDWGKYFSFDFVKPDNYKSIKNDKFTLVIDWTNYHCIGSLFHTSGRTVAWCELPIYPWDLESWYYDVTLFLWDPIFASEKQSYRWYIEFTPTENANIDEKLSLWSSWSFWVDEVWDAAIVTFTMNIENFYKGHKVEWESIDFRMNSSMNSNQCESSTRIDRISSDRWHITFTCRLSTAIYERTSNNQYEFFLAIEDSSKDLFTWRTTFSWYGSVKWNKYSNDFNPTKELKDDIYWSASCDFVTPDTFNTSFHLSDPDLDDNIVRKLTDVLDAFFVKVEEKYLDYENQKRVYDRVNGRIKDIQSRARISEKNKLILDRISNAIVFRIARQDYVFNCEKDQIDFDNLFDIN